MTFFRPFDLILLTLVILGASVAYSLMDEEPGAIAEVYVSNRKAASFNISGETEQKEIQTRIGKIKIEYGQGTIKVLHSPCNQKICVLTGAIRHTYEHIICLTAQMQIVLIRSTQPSDSESIDAISH